MPRPRVATVVRAAMLRCSALVVVIATTVQISASMPRSPPSKAPPAIPLVVLPVPPPQTSTTEEPPAASPASAESMRVERSKSEDGLSGFRQWRPPKITCRRRYTSDDPSAFTDGLKTPPPEMVLSLPLALTPAAPRSVVTPAGSRRSSLDISRPVPPVPNTSASLHSTPVLPREPLQDPPTVAALTPATPAVPLKRLVTAGLLVSAYSLTQGRVSSRQEAVRKHNLRGLRQLAYFLLFTGTAVGVNRVISRKSPPFLLSSDDPLLRHAIPEFCYGYGPAAWAFASIVSLSVGVLLSQVMLRFVAVPLLSKGVPHYPDHITFVS
ncbi:unnamed protein product (mitochondrion) [Plasmodiophora brassicae]|uniref:Uncharacterized protein n=2 Tax=Plasmodiophora brassicae TaxID=37360 RepID=A0A3P3YJS3_PLABS|nr:unnamed protein product [Plasmodiophora brassicae]